MEIVVAKGIQKTHATHVGRRQRGHAVQIAIGFQPGGGIASEDFTPYLVPQRRCQPQHRGKVLIKARQQ
ncbi:MAG: hypothetical protein CBC23_012160 [Rhodospirillaceae bacterium TMED63]|nr:MAG: hypothetical protein CBC23_012160 [Rhodospirillaceae bacterium TMED63]